MASILSPLKSLLAQVADNTALNPAITRRLGIVHLGCRNHLLNIGGKNMEKEDGELATVCEEAHQTHVSINSSTKTSATFENAQNAV